MRGGKLRKPEEITVGELDMHLASFFFYFLYVISNYIIKNTISHITPRISPRAFGSRADIGVSG